MPALVSFLLSATIGFGFGRKRPFAGLAVLLIGLLFHEALVKWLTFALGLPIEWVQGLSLWKDGLLIGLGPAVLVKSWRQSAAVRWRQLPQRLGPIGMALAAMVLVGALAVVLAPDLLAGLAALRDYYEPVLVFGIVLGLAPTRAQLSRLGKAWIVSGVVLAVVGLWQSFAWDQADYVRFGFGAAISDLGVPPLELNGRLILRAPSLVTGPNELGMHMLLLILLVCGLLVLRRGSNLRRSGLLLCLVLLSASLAYSYSRGDLVALPIGVVTLGLTFRLPGKKRDWVRLWPLLAAFLLALAFGYINGTVSTLVSTAAGFDEDYHIVDTSEAIDALLKQPQGVGMGQVGPRIGAFFPDQPRFHIEGSIFQIAFDMGLWGLAVWLVGLAVVLRRAWRTLSAIDDPMVDSLARTGLSGWLALVPVALFIPILQSLSMMSWMWFLLGLAVKGPQLERSD